ncbi:MAG: succinylglutamate desuccinylase/aspartoacylase family protein, partial [Candidatus Poribacteria bacterium]|nr:succinylglutamate desuccinylase/aspartoacylase family protein [Candidatus Poribacteria bacterium]
TGAVHGNEYEGVEAIPRIYEQVEPDVLHGTLVMLPVCNMPAYETGTRNSPIDGLNLARVFPGDAHGTITRRIAYWLTHKLIKHADFFIDLHSAGIESNIPMMIGYRHSEDELGQRARAAAHAFGAPVMWGHPPSGTSGRSISTATEYGVPWLYTESPGGGRAGPDDVACYIHGVLNVMKHLGMIRGEPHPKSPTHHLVGDGNLDVVISAPAAGSFRPHVELLDEVNVGQRLGIVEDFFGQVAGEVTADRDGVVILLRRLPQVNAGEGVAQITGKYSED